MLKAKPRVKTTIPVERLARAWPDGWLAMCGVQTISGWTCIREGVSPLFVMPSLTSPPTVHWYVTDPNTFRSSEHAPSVRYGELLPNVDPADTATWACLLADLAIAAGLPTEGSVITFTCRKSFSGQKHWRLLCENPIEPRNGISTAFGIDTDDPAEALVWARIQLRESENGD